MSRRTAYRTAAGRTGAGRLDAYRRRLVPAWAGPVQARLATARRDLPPLVVDAIIASACFLIFAIYAVTEDKVDGGHLLLAVANSVPLLWRRRFPLLVTFVVGVSTIWLAMAEALPHFPPAQLVATYTFAALSSPPRRVVGVVGTALGIVLSLLVPDEPAGAYGLVGISFTAAYALGTGARARRDRIAMLEERTRRLAEEQAAAATRERHRIAREMHDILAHSMSLVIVQAEAGPIAVRSDPDQAERVFDTISATARESLAQLRRALGVLRATDDDPAAAAPDRSPTGSPGGSLPGSLPGSPPGRQPQPGLAGLPALVASVEAAGLVTRLEQRGTPGSLPADLATTAYRIVQESLTNILRHARATTADVRLTWQPGRLRLEICDDGRGPDGNGRMGGHGLVGMRERVAIAGGELATGPGPAGVGFRVAATLPIPDPPPRPGLQ